MERIYKPRIGKAIMTVIGSLLLAGFVLIVRMEPILTDKTVPWIAGAIVGLTLLFLPSMLRIKLVVTDESLTLHRGKKVTTYALDSYGFGARTNNNGSQYLIIYLPDGRTDEVDCEFLSEKDFKRLTDDLAITGPKQQAVKVTVKEKSIIEE